MDIVERLRAGKCHPGTIADPQECEAPEGECLCAIQADAADTITSLRLRISELEGKWQPIETAPKGEGREWERPTVSLWAAGRARHGRWCPDEYAARPKPFWSIETQLGVAWMRANQPTHWQPLPPPPQSGDK